MQGVTGGAIDVRGLFRSSSEVMDEAYENILKYQRKEFQPAKTGYGYLDEALLGGLYPKHVLTIGARPGVGKSYFSQKILKNVMDPILNPQSIDYVLVNCEFEMNPMDLLMRRFNQETGKSMQRILGERMNSVEEKKFQQILGSEKRNNIAYVTQPLTVEELDAVINHIMYKNKDKRLVIFKVDHIALVKRNGGDAKRTMDGALAVMNQAKMRYPNIFFLIVSQLNRDIEGRIKDPKEQPPRLSDFYQSDELGQLSSLMVAMHNPRRLGLSKYMSFQPNWYPRLNKFKSGETKTSFMTEGLLFHHVVKSRIIPIEDLEEPIHIEVMPKYRALYNMGDVRNIKVEPEPIPELPYTEMNEEMEESPFG